ncbi:hypothetical protein CSB11_00160 [Candidatus Campbellbacteria bacterium]|nr:MAG: hypothetical protein CSB11_00160 [Candidatus Campbellbacteria bacterium]
MKNKIYDLIIVGGGPAAVAAGVYAARKKLKTLIITDDFGGQSIVSEGIQNWIGEIEISGLELKKKLEENLNFYKSEDFEIKKYTLVEKIKTNKKDFTITTNKKEKFKSKTVLIATGGTRKKLPAKNADKFEHKGLTYCATCDGPLFAGKDVVVVGGGNAAFESAAQLLAYAKSVTLLQRSDKFKAEPMTVKNVLKHKNMKAILNTEVKEVLGGVFVNGIVVKNNKTNKEKEMKTDGIFVEIGSVPATGFSEDIKKDKTGHIKINCKNQRTNVNGIWAAGDCTDVLYRQNGIAMGDAIKAIEDIYIYLKG